MSVLTNRAERHRLARMLDVDVNELDGLRGVDAQHLTDLRHALQQAIKEHTDHKLHLIIAASRIVPTAIAGPIVERTGTPRLSARLSAMLEPEKSADFIHHVSTDFVARIGSYADPSATSRIIPHMPEDKVVAVGAAMARAGDMVGSGRLIGLLSDAAIAAVITEVRDADELLELLLLLEEPDDVGRIVGFVDDDLLRAAMTAATRDADDLAATRELLGHADEATRTRIGALVDDDAEQLLLA